MHVHTHVDNVHAFQEREEAIHVLMFCSSALPNLLLKKAGTRLKNFTDLKVFLMKFSLIVVIVNLYLETKCNT